MYPALIDLSRHRCLVVGGGRVAARKVHGLLDCGAVHPRVVSPQFREEFPGMTDGAIEHIIDRYRAEHLTGITLAIAATDRPDVNDAVVREAQARGILVNRADGGEEPPGNFVTPAYFREGPAVVAISTESPALSARLRDQLQAQWNPRWTLMAEAMLTLRPELRRRPDEAERRHLFKRLADDDAMEVLATGGIDALRIWIGKQASR